MDSEQSQQVNAPKRPLLGVWVVVTCLAGGAATQNLAVVPHSVAQVDLRFDPAQRLPAVEITSGNRAATLVAPPTFRQFRRLDSAHSVPAEGEAGTAMPDSGYAANGLDRGNKPEAPATALTSFDASPLPAAVQLPLAAAVPTPAATTEPSVGLAASRQSAFDAAFAGLGAPTVEQSLPETARPAEPITAALANPPELRGFDLARVVPSGLRKPAQLVAPRTTVRTVAGAAKPPTGGKRDRLLDATVFHHTAIMIGGELAGQVDVRIGADMKPSIKVGDLLAMVSAQMDPELAAHLSAASGTADYVSFAALRDAGFKVSYNAGADSVSIGVAD